MPPVKSLFYTAKLKGLTVINRLFKLLKSKRTAVCLMAAILCYTVLALYSGDLLGNPFNSWWFITLLILLAVNILTCTVFRLFLNRGKKDTLPFTWQAEMKSKSPVNELQKKLEDAFHRRKFALDRVDGILWARKNSCSWWGSVLFHLGMVVVLTGFAVSALWGMKGSVFAEEGVPLNFKQHLHNVKTGPFFKDLPDYPAVLREIKPIERGGVIEQVQAVIEFPTGGQPVKKEVAINKPVKHRGYTWRSHNWGYAPYLTVRNNAGEILLDNYVNIVTHSGRSFYDHIKLEDGTVVRVELIPDAASTGNYGYKSVLPLNPVVMVSGTKGQEEAAVPLGQRVVLGGLEVSFNSVRRWGLFDVSYDPGWSLIYVGGLATVAGIAWRGLFTGKQVWITIEEMPEFLVIRWTSRADYHNELFREEIEKLIYSVKGGKT